MRGRKDMKGKIICIFVTVLLVTTTLSAVGETTNSNGSIDSIQKTEPNYPDLFKPIQSMQGDKIAVTNSGCLPEETKSQLEQWGYIVDLLDISSISVDILLNYNIVWITNGASLDIEIELKDDEIRDYVYQGGGLVFCQPNYVVEKMQCPIPPICISFRCGAVSGESGKKICR